jgi:cytochrome P450
MVMLDFPIDRETPIHPPLYYKEARGKGRFPRVKLWNGNEVWLVTRYEDVRAVLRSNAFSVDSALENYPSVYPTQQEAARKGLRKLSNTDGDEHGRLRRMVASVFAPRKIAELRPMVNDIIRELLDRAEEQGPAADLYTQFALPLTSQVLARVVGIPYEARHLFQRAAHTIFDMSSDPDEAIQASIDMAAYLESALNAALDATGSQGGDDLLALLAREIRATAVTHEEAIALALLVIRGGFDTTANTIALGMLLFLQDRRELEVLLANHDLLGGAVEEVLRFTSVARFSARRVALTDIEIGNTRIGAGDGVLALVDSANRDSEVFEQPDRFRISRGKHGHLTFADGIHLCLGQHLARLEISAALDAVFRRFPQMELLDGAPIEFTTGNRVHGISNLPVLLSPSAR